MTSLVRHRPVWNAELEIRPKHTSRISHLAVGEHLLGHAFEVTRGVVKGMSLMMRVCVSMLTSPSQTETIDFLVCYVIVVQY